MGDSTRDKPKAPEITDEPGMAERFQRGLQRALHTPPKPRLKPTLKVNRKSRERSSHNKK